MPEAPIPVASGGPQGEFRGVWRGGVSGSPGPEGGLWGWILGGGVWGPHSPAERCAVRSCCLCVAAACGAPAQRTAAPDVGLGWQQKRWFFSPKKLCASSSSAPPPPPLFPGPGTKAGGQRGGPRGGGQAGCPVPPPIPALGRRGRGGGRQVPTGHVAVCVCVSPPLPTLSHLPPGSASGVAFQGFFFFVVPTKPGGWGGGGCQLSTHPHHH